MNDISLDYLTEHLGDVVADEVYNMGISEEFSVKRAVSVNEAGTVSFLVFAISREDDQ